MKEDTKTTEEVPVPVESFNVACGEEAETAPEGAETPETVEESKGEKIAPQEAPVEHVEVVEAPVPVCGRCSKPKKHPNERERCHCGRPMTYSAEIVEKAQEYLKEHEEDEEDEFHKTRGEKSDGFVRLVKVKLPTIEGLARYLKVNKVTLYEWEKQFEEFSNLMDDLRQMQAERLISKGLSGDYSPVISKVLLTKHGYRDAVDTFNREVPVDPEAKDRSDTAIDEYLKTPKQ